MRSNDIIQQLRACSGEAKSLGATSLFLFGSVSRNEQTDDSDVDLFLDYDVNTRFSLIELAGLKALLEEKIGRSVDVTTRDSLHPRLKADIERSAIRIF